MRMATCTRPMNNELAIKVTIFLSANVHERKSSYDKLTIDQIALTNEEKGRTKSMLVIIRFDELHRDSNREN